jgi:hypothetical protein
VGWAPRYCSIRLRAQCRADVPTSRTRSLARSAVSECPNRASLRQPEPRTPNAPPSARTVTTEGRDRPPACGLEVRLSNRFAPGRPEQGGMNPPMTNRNWWDFWWDLPSASNRGAGLLRPRGGCTPDGRSVEGARRRHPVSGAGVPDAGRRDHDHLGRAGVRRAAPPPGFGALVKQVLGRSEVA